MNATAIATYAAAAMPAIARTGTRRPHRRLASSHVPTPRTAAAQNGVTSSAITVANRASVTMSRVGELDTGRPSLSLVSAATRRVAGRRRRAARSTATQARTAISEMARPMVTRRCAVQLMLMATGPLVGSIHQPLNPPSTASDSPRSPDGPKPPTQSCGPFRRSTSTLADSRRQRIDDGCPTR